MEIEIKVTLTLPDEMPEACKNYLDSYFRPIVKELAAGMVTPVTEEKEHEPALAEEVADPAAGEAAPVVDDDDDLPYSVSNEDLRDAVKAAREKVGSQAIWNLFARYGIKASIDCPDQNRPQLYAELKSLAA